MSSSSWYMARLPVATATEIEEGELPLLQGGVCEPFPSTAFCSWDLTNSRATSNFRFSKAEIYDMSLYVFTMTQQ